MSESNPELVDIDADGDEDFLVGDYWGWIRFYSNEGSPLVPNFKFSTAQFDSIYVAESRSNPCFRDMDADGDLDLLVGDIDSYVHFYRNVGTPYAACYALETDSLVPPGPPWCVAPELADIDADGDYDLFGGWQQISFYRNDGNAQNFNFNLVSANFAGANISGWASVDFVDIDADGDYDLFIGERYGKLWYYRNDGDSVNYNFTYVSNYFDSIDVGDYSSPEFADIDGDGDYDLFVGREPVAGSLMGDVFFYENVGTAGNPDFQLVTQNYLALDVGFASLNPQIVDMNGDQAPDLVVATGDQLDYFINTGDSLNPAFSLAKVGFQGISRSVIKPCFADLDADGDLDLLAGEGVIPGPPTVALYINRGTAQIPQLELYDANFVTNSNFWVNADPGLADIDADGDYDLFINDDATGYFCYYENTGTAQWPNFTLMNSQWQGIQDPGGWRGFCFGDLDDDGDLDMLMAQHTAYQEDANLRYYRNDGTAYAASMTLVTTSLLQDSVGMACPYLADIDLDG
ncbi:MAG TPA: VCBS repeat-containing protein, partial [bacterium]